MSQRRLRRCRSYARFDWLRQSTRVRIVNRMLVAKIDHQCTPRFF